MSLTEKAFYHNWTETISEYEWTLYNFSSYANTDGQPIKSKVFSNQVSDFKSDLKWQIHLYPDGDAGIDSKGYVGVYLRSLNDFEVSVDWEFTISSNIKSYGSKNLSHTFTKESNNWGYCKHVNSRILLDDLKKGNDVLIITWTMFFFQKSQNSCLELITNFESLLTTGENSDVILVSNDGKKHKAHKAILMCRSKVFSAMFKHNMKESQDNIVNIEDVDDETLKAILYFIYTGKVKNMYKDAKNLLMVADKYELDSLKKMCIFHLSENITIHNVLDLIDFSEIYNICELKTTAKEYFLKNHTEIMLNKGLESIKDLSRHTVDNLLHDLAIQL